MKIKVHNGKVKYLQKQGNEYVGNDMPVSVATQMIQRSKVLASKVEGYPIRVKVGKSEFLFQGEDDTAEE